MKSLIVEDDFISRLLTQQFLLPFGECHIAVNGTEATAAFENALAMGEPYDLVCLDIMMPQMDGQEALREIRSIEERKGILIGDGVKVIMMTALSDIHNKLMAFNESCDAYLVKPIERARLIEILQSFKLAG